VIDYTETFDVPTESGQVLGDSAQTPDQASKESGAGAYMNIPIQAQNISGVASQRSHQANKMVDNNVTKHSNASARLRAGGIRINGSSAGNSPKTSRIIVQPKMMQKNTKLESS